MNEWKPSLAEGLKLLSIAEKTADSKKFTGSIRYNLAAMGFEKCVISVCAINDTLPENHTLTDLMDILTRFIPVDQESKMNILKYENVQMLCSINDYQREMPSDFDTNNFIESTSHLCNKMACYCRQSCTVEV